MLATALGGSGGDTAGGSVTLNMPPQWVQVSDDVTASMARIKDRLNQLAALHARALLPNFDEFSGEDAKVEVLTQEITRLFKRCEKSLQALSASQATDPGDGKVRQNVVRSMAADLQKLSMDFRRKQKDYLTKLKQLQDRGPGGDVFGDLTGGGGGEGEGGGSSYDVGFTDIQIQRTNTMIDEAIARDQEVVKIIESVNELAAIMKDLSVLVIDQGTVLDRIDYNVEQVSTHVEEAVKQLTKAYVCPRADQELCRHMLTPSRGALQGRDAKEVLDADHHVHPVRPDHPHDFHPGPQDHDQGALLKRQPGELCRCALTHPRPALSPNRRDERGAEPGGERVCVCVCV